MFLDKKLCLVFVELCMIVVCKAEYDYFNKISSYVRFGSSEIADTVSSYYNEYTQQKSVQNVGKGDEEVDESRAEAENACEKKLRECKITMNDIPDTTLSRRIINMLLSRAELREGDSLFRGRVELEATALELEALKTFGLGISTLREIAPIINNVIKTAEFDGAYESALWLNSSTTVLFNFIASYKDAFIAIFSVLYLFRLLRNVRWNFWVIFFIGIQVVFIISFLVTWRQLLQGENIEVPIQCQPDKMRWTDKMMAFVSSPEDCERYYEAKIKDPPLEITPQHALLRTLDRVTWGTVVLCSKIGSICLKFLTNGLPQLGFWIVQTLASLNGFSIIIIFSAMLALFYCSCHYSRRPKNSATRQSLNSNNEPWIMRFMQNLIDGVKSNDTNNLVVKENIASRDRNEAVKIANGKKRISTTGSSKSEENVMVNSQELSGFKVLKRSFYFRRKYMVRGRNCAKKESDGG